MKQRTVLVAVLDWGLGHATRSIPVIRELQRQAFNVILAGSGKSLELLKDEFPDLLFHELPAYNVHYGNSGMVKSLLIQLPKITSTISQEFKQVQDIVRNEKIDLIISDNRYGCYSKSIKSIFICHQLNLQIPKSMSFLKNAINKLHLKRLSNFDEIWIPDNKSGFKYSGILSETSQENIKHIGILSRFGDTENSSSESFEIAALVSGPEPQRTTLENSLSAQLLQSGKKSILVKGLPGNISRVVTNNLTEVDHLNSNDLESVLRNSAVVISRSGYSSIMDFAKLGLQAILIPTPGQTEQEYLASYFDSQNLAVVSNQNDFNLEIALTRLESVNAIPKSSPESQLRLAIESL